MCGVKLIGFASALAVVSTAVEQLREEALVGKPTDWKLKLVQGVLPTFQV